MSPLSIKGGWIRPALTQGYLSNVSHDKHTLTIECKSLQIVILHNASNLYRPLIFPTTTYLAQIAVCNTHCGIGWPDDHEQKLGHTCCSNNGFKFKIIYSNQTKAKISVPSATTSGCGARLVKSKPVTSQPFKNLGSVNAFFVFSSKTYVTKRVQ